MKIGVAIMSFNRPQYLEPTLKSIVAQDNQTNLEYYLFQDNTVNRFSKIRYAEDKDIHACIKLFRQYIPNGNVQLHPDNVGVAINYDYAERLFFNDKKYNYGIFLEDDLILNKNYLSIIRRMMHTFKDSKIVAMMAAYGNQWLRSLDEQRKAQNSIVFLEHHWGFIIRRDLWIERQKKLGNYLDIILNVDYRKRPNEKIIQWQRSLGCRKRATSQDQAKAIAMNAAGQFKINTYTVNAKYIGKIGLHMKEKIYLNRNYEDTILFDGPTPKINNVTDEEIEKMRIDIFQRTLKL